MTEPFPSHFISRRTLLQSASSVLGLNLVSPAVLASSLAQIRVGHTHSSLLLVDESSTPHLHLSWPCEDGSTTTYDLDLPYTNPGERTHLGDNLDAFVAMGGTRLEKGAGRPDGAILRVGFQKINSYPLMFAHIANGASLSLKLTRVRFNQPIFSDPQTILQRMEYTVDDIVACGITIDESEMFNMVSDTDTMNDTILPTQVRHATLDNNPPGDGFAQVMVAEDGATVAIHAQLPYSLLRHKNDPWGMTVPGTFFEPLQMHLEVEILPIAVAIAEGLTPSQ